MENQQKSMSIEDQFKYTIMSNALEASQDINEVKNIAKELLKNCILAENLIKTLMRESLGIEN